MSKYAVTLTYLVVVEANNASEAEKIAIQEVEDGEWNPNNIETEKREY